jgi:enoyl-CoA hydratase/carnithine racemase
VRERWGETNASRLDAVLFEIVDDHIAVVTLNRPEVRKGVNTAVAHGVDAAV